jgi:hypothetical protein
MIMKKASGLIHQRIVRCSAEYEKSPVYHSAYGKKEGS